MTNRITISLNLDDLMILIAKGTLRIKLLPLEMEMDLVFGDLTYRELYNAINLVEDLKIKKYQCKPKIIRVV